MTAHHPVRRRALLLLALGGAVAVWLSCGEPGLAPDGVAPDSAAVIPGLIVSNPVLPSGPSSLSLNSAQDEVAYISLPPGSLTGVLSVRLRNLTTNGPPTETVPVLDGGFDPVAVVARAGDRLALMMSLQDGAVTASYLTVPVRRPPRIVRTAPPKGRTDVALNTRPLIVFSEPIDARTLSSATVQLLAGGASLSGTAAPVPGDALQAEFTPSAPLAPNTAYELLITTGVRDLEGDALESSERVPFTTQVGDGRPSVAFLTLSAPPAIVVPGLRFGLFATALANDGIIIPDRNVSWSSSDSSVAKVPGPGALTKSNGTSGISVHVTRAGSTTITASSEGRSTSMTIIVDEGPVSTALEIETISLIEFQYPSSDQWYYAPQLRIKEPAGRASATFVAAYFHIPGFGLGPFCTTRRTVAAGQTLDVYREFYGDFEAVLYQPGVRASAREAPGIIYLIDANGRLGHISVSVPIVAGSLPTTYSGGRVEHPWVCRPPATLSRADSADSAAPRVLASRIRVSQ